MIAVDFSYKLAVDILAQHERFRSVIVVLIDRCPKSRHCGENFSEHLIVDLVFYLIHTVVEKIRQRTHEPGFVNGRNECFKESVQKLIARADAGYVAGYAVGVKVDFV